MAEHARQAAVRQNTQNTASVQPMSGVAVRQIVRQERGWDEWQSVLGNQAVQRSLLAGQAGIPALQRKCTSCQHESDDDMAGIIQTKLAINRPGDAFEQEADRVADAVMSGALALSSFTANRQPRQTVQRSCACGGTCEDCQGRVQRTSSTTDSVPRNATAPPIVHQVLRSPGRQLDRGTRTLMESRFGTDFGHVRVHSDSQAAESARKVDALAYTIGKNVVFGAGQYQPASQTGQKLLAHELAHVIQQTGNSPQPLRRSSIAVQRQEQEGGNDDQSIIELDPLPAPAFGDQSNDPGCPKTPARLGELNPSPPCPTSTEEISGEMFQFCKDTDIFQKPDDRPRLINFVRNQRSNATFKIHGYASIEGGTAYNTNLACHRTKRVARELINAGVPSAAITIAGKGPTQRFGAGTSESVLKKNRVVLVAVAAPEAVPDGVVPSDPRAVIELAKAKIEHREYRLAADAYMSLWSCGEIPTIAEAVRRSTIVLEGDPGAPRTSAINPQGDVIGHAGINTTLLNQHDFTAANLLECITARLIADSFHQFVYRKIGFDEANKASLFVVELAGLDPCREPDLSSPGLPTIVGAPFWVRPKKDPRQGLQPTCPNLSGALPGPLGSLHGKIKQPPSFAALTTSIHEGRGNAPVRVRASQNLVTMETADDALNASATVEAKGDPEEIKNYEIGYIQTILDADTRIDYVAGHQVQETLPVPIRDGRPNSAGGRAPWFEPDPAANAVTKPDPATGTAQALLFDGPSFTASLRYIDLQRSTLEPGFVLDDQGNRHPVPPRIVLGDAGNVISRASRHIKFNQWLVARRVDAPLDRFSTVFLDGTVIDFFHNVEFVGAVGTGTFHSTIANGEVSDQSSMQLSGPVPADLGPLEKNSLTNPKPRGQAGGLTLDQYRAQVTQLAEPIRRQMGLLRNVFVQVRINTGTGRVAFDNPDFRAVTAEGDGVPQATLNDFAQRLFFVVRKDLVLAPLTGHLEPLGRVPVSMRPLP